MAKPADEAKRASIHDVARLADVSASTVSKILRGVTTVKQRHVESVMAAIQELDYRMDPLASSLRSQERRMIGAIVPEFDSTFFSAIVTELERLAESRGYTLVASSSRESETRESELIERMRDWRVAGIVLAPVRNEHGKAAQLLRKYDLRSVFIDRVLADDVFDTVASDGAAASRTVAEHLAKLGHRHFLVVSLPEEAASLTARLSGFTRAIKELVPQAQIDVLHCESDADVLRGRIARYFDNGGRPTAVYTLFLKATLVALNEIRRRQWSIPDEISIVGFDDAEWMQVTHPAVAAVVQPISTISQHAIELLFNRSTGFTGGPISRIEPCSVQWRSSTGPANRP